MAPAVSLLYERIKESLVLLKKRSFISLTFSLLETSKAGVLLYDLPPSAFLPPAPLVSIFPEGPLSFSSDLPAISVESGMPRILAGSELPPLSPTLSPKLPRRPLSRKIRFENEASHLEELTFGNSAQVFFRSPLPNCRVAPDPELFSPFPFFASRKKILARRFHFITIGLPLQFVERLTWLRSSSLVERLTWERANRSPSFSPAQVSLG